jgi:PAB-dependent poly(A)-specific ribonuclease subunit 2
MIHRLPAVLNLLAGMLNEEQRKLWATPGWLPEEIGVIIAGDGQFYCFEGDDIKYQLQRGYHNMVVYSLTGLAVNIESGHSSKGSHLIAMANGMTPPPTIRGSVTRD